MKTLEFKLKLNQQQQQTIDSWLDSMRWVWNEGLSLLLEHESLNRHEFYQAALENPDEHRRFWKNMGLPNFDGASYDGVRWSHLRLNRKGFGASCQIAVGRDCRPAQTLPLPNASRLSQAKGTLSHKLKGNINKTRYPDHPAIAGVPLVFIRGTLDNLNESWKAYKTKSRDKSYLPKFKSFHRGDRVTTLHCGDCSKSKIFDGPMVKTPGFRTLGPLRTVNRQSEKRWPTEVQPKSLKIVKRASGYYFQATGSIPTPKPKPSTKTCGLDVGLEYIYSDDDGKQVDPPKYYRKSERRLKHLQRKLSRQVKGSARYAKTQKAIAKCHEKIGNQRRTFNHKLSTFLVRKFGGIAVENIQLTNLSRRPKPKKREDGDGYEQNNAAAKAGLNKSFADAGLGQLLLMIEAKAKVAERKFVKVNPAYTSQECPNCEHIQKKALSQRSHQCGECGHVEPRDTAAAKIIKRRAEFSLSDQANIYIFKT